MDLILGLGLSFLSSAAVVGEERSVTHRVGGTSGDYCSLEAQSCCRRECVQNSCIVLITPIDWFYAAWQTMHPEHIVNSLYLHACKIFAYPPSPQVEERYLIPSVYAITITATIITTINKAPTSLPA